MRRFPTTPCLAAVAAVLAAGPALAATSVSTSTTTPLVTSVAGDVTVTSDGTISVPSGATVTVDSNNTVSNAGSLKAGGANGASGVTVNAGTTSTITNSGTIAVTESFVPADADANGIADGPIASASNRYGIHTLAGGTVTGNVVNSGTITVEGLNSGGIVLDGTLAGSLTNSGTITVTGDYSTAIKTGAVTGNVLISNGTVTAVGEGATALAVNGDVGGTVTIQGTVQQAVTFTNDNSATVTLSRSDLRVGAAAATISGNVAGGVIVAVPPTLSSSDSDVDDDGIADSSEGTGSIVSYGNGPALQIGGATPITIGPVTGYAGGYSLVVDGSVKGNAYYTSTDAYAVVIGGQGGTVNLPGGIAVNGTVTATTVDSTATALLINSGATVPKLYNSGTISGAISSPGDGTVYGVRDLSGTLTSIENTGVISVGGTSDDVRKAIDLSSNTTGVTINQHINDADATTRAGIEKDGTVDTTVYTSISGDIVTGSGNDTLTASDGTITGNTYFNAGDDTLQLSGRAVYTGNVNFGTGAASAALSGTSSFTGSIDFAGVAGVLTIADTAKFSGNILNGGAASVTVNGGTFRANAANTITVNTLTVNSGGTLGVYVDSASHTSSHVVANTATFADGAKVSATVSSLVGAEGSYTVLTAGTLSGKVTFDSAATSLPYIFNGSVTASGNDLILTIERKTADEIGLRRAAAQGYNAILDAAVNDTKMSGDILGITDGATLQSHFDQLLPDHAGGIFDSVTRASRLAAQHIMDSDSIFDVDDSKVSGWFEPVMWRASKDTTDTQSYKVTGWGLSGGLERVTGIGRFGLSYAWLKGDIDDNGGTGKLKASQHEFGLSWRLAQGPFYAFARGSAARVSVSSARTFDGTNAGTAFTYSNTAKWKGWLYSATAGASYDFKLGDQFKLRPKAVLDYYRLDENGYTETGGGEAMDLTVAARNSTALNATTTMTASYSFGRPTRDLRPLTLELEGGRRNFLSGALGTTNANFTDGDVFSITPDKQQSAWIGEVRLLAGGFDFTWKLAARAERTDYGTDYSGRASLSVAF
ncbi:MAG TPA: autotransporter domain-containing protein [Novosphingobium sp.]